MCVCLHVPVHAGFLFDQSNTKKNPITPLGCIEAKWRLYGSYMEVV